MEYKDYYNIFGIERDANQDEVKRAYRKLARKFHPDVSKEADAEERFKELNEAYSVLKDPEKRAAYDELGANWKAGQDFQPPPGWEAGFEFRGPGSNAGSAAHSDFFDALFGHGFGSTQSHRAGHGVHLQGEDHHARVLIDLEDAFHGATRSVTLRTPELDSEGNVKLVKRTLNVRIPTGISPGQQIRLKGQGSAGIGRGEAGDLYLEVAFKPHTIYTVSGKDIFMDLPIAPWEAALGATVKVPTPEGRVDLKIPRGTKTGNKLRLQKRGIPSSPPGDLYVAPVVVTPPADSDADNQLYRQMQAKMNFNPRSDLGV